MYMLILIVANTTSVRWLPSSVAYHTSSINRTAQSTYVYLLFQYLGHLWYFIHCLCTASYGFVTFQMVSRQFPGYDFVRKNFKFKVPVDGSEPALDIHYESTLPHGWVAPLKGFTREVSLFYNI